MKTYRIFAVIAMLVLASLACQAMTGGGDSEGGDDLPPVSSEDEGSPVPPSSSDPGSTGEGNSSDSEFPMTDDSYNITDIGDGSVLYYTKMPLEDVMDFYRDEYTAMGYEERELLTVVTDGIFSMVFDGDPSGMAVVIQSVDLGNGSRTVTIRLEDV
jgi:hypothetical protein